MNGVIDRSPFYPTRKAPITATVMGGSRGTRRDRPPRTAARCSQAQSRAPRPWFDPPTPPRASRPRPPPRPTSGAGVPAGSGQRDDPVRWQPRGLGPSQPAGALSGFARGLRERRQPSRGIAQSRRGSAIMSPPASPASPVLTVPSGSMSNTWVSSCASGRCSTPAGTTNSSPGSSSTSRSRRWIDIAHDSGLVGPLQQRKLVDKPHLLGHLIPPMLRSVPVTGRCLRGRERARSVREG